MMRLGSFFILAMAAAAHAQFEPGQGQAGGRRGQRPIESGTGRPQLPTTPGLPAGIQPTGATAAPLSIAPVSTEHTITYRGAPLAYTATAGTLALKTEDGTTDGSLFFVAYTKKGEESGTRPITFVYNGGPGSSSVYVHMGTMGAAPCGAERRWHDAQAAV